MIAADGWRAVLGDEAATIGALTRAVGEGEAASVNARKVRIGLSSNVTVDLLGLFLRREALLGGVRAEIVAGNYDDPVGDLARFSAEGVSYAVVLPFFDNILPALEQRLEAGDPALLAAKEEEWTARLRLAFEAGRSLDAVYVGSLHRFGRAVAAAEADPVTIALARLNAALQAEAARHANVRLIDMADLVAEIGRAQAFDDRFYFRAKAPYSQRFMNRLAARVGEMSRRFGAYFYKALVLDCDNTLWGGVIGEDLIGGIKLDPFDAPGNVFWRVQAICAALQRQGVLLCLATKNNPDDVAEVFADHPGMLLRDEHVTVRRVNWDDKVSNLVAIAEELNIGLDSLVFVDDSSVECESVRSRLPMVRVVQVPKQLTEYPRAMEGVAALFLAGGVSADARNKADQYRQRAAAAAERRTAGSHEDYLASLELMVTLRRNVPADAPRIAELSQKSNQFNLTTRRYSQAAIDDLMAAKGVEVVSVTVANKFGDAGLTGVAILCRDGDVATVENFWMSCRVLGQGVEIALWRPIIDRLRTGGVTELRAQYLATAKNAQVAGFWDRIGLSRIDGGEGVRYAAAVADLSIPASPWIRITDD